MNVDEIIRALRCTNTAGADRPDYNCMACSYGCVERIPFAYHQMADFWRDYEPYAYNCQCDKIGLDAADELERLQRSGGRWILPHEQKPEKDTPILISVRMKDGKKIVIVSRYWVDSFGTEHWLSVPTKFVEAWMPMPEPYKG